MKRFIVLLLVLSVVFTSFASGSKEVEKPFEAVTVKDQIGREVTVSEKPQKIVSGYYISSSACIALGLKDNIVGIESLSNKRPIYKLAAPALMEVTDVGTAKAFNLEACLATEPDIVILPKKQKDTANILTEMGIPAIVVNPESHEQILEMFELFGKVLGKEKEAEKLISYYKGKLDFVEKKVADAKTKPVVYMCGTGSYLTTAPKDMYQGSLIESAGGKNAGDVINGSSWTEISYEQLIAMNPDIIVIPTNSNANGTPDYSINDILNDKQLSKVNAVVNKAVYQMPVGYEAWDSPAPSGILGTLWMLSTVHPELYSPAEFEKEVKSFYSTFYGF